MLNERGRRRAASPSLQNFLTATEIATLFLHRDQRILRFTPRVTGLFHVRMNERGRPVSDPTQRLGFKYIDENS
jgi:two-component system, chemotaxis family, CheB/CheR fusion protein